MLSNQKENNSFELSWDFRKSLVFVNINKKEENKDVIKFQKTQDLDILEIIYHRRVPSLQIWARKYAYLVNDFDDMYGELTYHFVKSVYGYDHKRGSFNTFLFSTLLYCIRNKKSREEARKRRPYGVKIDDARNFVLSLDHNYNQKDGAENNLKDILKDVKSENKIAKDICLIETIKILSRDDKNIGLFLKKLSEGGTVTSLLRDIRTKHGKIKISKIQAKKLNLKKRCNRIVSNLIKDKNDICDKFQLVKYHIKDLDKLHYTIEMKKTLETDKIMKTIRKLRRNKDKYLEILQG